MARAARARSGSGRVGDLLGPRALLLGNDKPSIGNKMLVIAEAPPAGLFLLSQPGEAIAAGDVAQATGPARRFDVVERGNRLGVDPDAARRDHGRAVLVARAIDPDLPVAAAAGDKEFGAALAGFGPGVTTE